MPAHDPTVPFTAKSIGCENLADQYEDVANKNDLRTGEITAWMAQYLELCKDTDLLKRHRASFATEHETNGIKVTALYPRISFLGHAKSDVKFIVRAGDSDAAKIAAQVVALEVSRTLTLMQ